MDGENPFWEHFPSASVSFLYVEAKNKAGK